jgi:predicted ArsR family transcriptional regulator
VAIWFKAGVTRSTQVTLTSKLRLKLGIGRKAAYRGLTALEKAGLVDVKRAPGRCPVVTIRHPQDKDAPPEHHSRDP